MEGYIKLHRKILDWQWFHDGKTLKLFIYILTSANYEDKYWGKVLIEKGSFVTSLIHLSSILNLSIQNVRTALSNLQLTHEITIKTTNKYTVINVVNWGLYQSQELVDNKQTNKKTNIPLTNEQQTTNTNVLNKELKEVKNLKECIIDNTQEIANFWNEKMKDTKIPTVRLPLTDTRKTHLKQRIEEMSLETIYEVVEKTYKSDFLRGLKTTFVGSFDFCFSSPNNFTKILEGNYDNQEIVVKPKNPLKDENVKQYGGTYL